MDKNAAKLLVTIPTDGTEERRITQPSLDVIELDDSNDDKPEVVEEIKTKENTEKIAETRKVESEVVEEVPAAEKEE